MENAVPFRFLVPLIVAGFITLGLAACASSGVQARGIPGAPAPEAAVERFLQLVQQKQYLEMGWVFGTQEGPVLERDPAGDVERRMYALANLLDHRSYTIQPGVPVPGRVGAAIQFQVALQRSRGNPVVPFTAVRGPDGRWFVEQIGIQAITGG